MHDAAPASSKVSNRSSRVAVESPDVIHDGAFRSTSLGQAMEVLPEFDSFDGVSSKVPVKGDESETGSLPKRQIEHVLHNQGGPVPLGHSIDVRIVEGRGWELADDVPHGPKEGLSLLPARTSLQSATTLIASHPQLLLETCGDVGWWVTGVETWSRSRVSSLRRRQGRHGKPKED